MYDQKQAPRDTSGKVFLVWRRVLDKPGAALIYGALPETNEAKRGWLQTIELTGDDRKLSLEEAAEKFPYRSVK